MSVNQQASSSAGDEKRELILNAAIAQFSQYGYRKTSMEDLARAAGISRPSLYSYFENKEEIFRSLAQMLNEKALGEAESHMQSTRGEQSVLERIEGALLAFNVSLYRLLDESPHGAELMDETHRLSGDLAQTYYGKFQALIATELDHAAEQGELDLKAAGVTAADAAEVIRFAVIGLKAGGGGAAGFQNRVEQFIRVYLSGLTAQRQ